VAFSLGKFPYRTVSLVTLAIFVLTIAGCSKTATVTGKVTVDDKPLTKGGIRFVPDKAKGNTSPDEAIGTINETGVYELRTNNQAGVPPGWYKVCVHSTDMPDNTNPSAPLKSYVDGKYDKPETTDVSIEVKSGAPAGAYDLKLSAGSGTLKIDTTSGSGVIPMPK
jgi:hypothetical protein